MSSHSTRSPRFTTHIRATCGIGVVALAFAASSGCKDSGQKVTPPPPVVTASTPISGAYKDFDEFTARVTAQEAAELRARVGGYLEAVHFEAGDTVNEGDLLFTIDQSTYQAFVAGAEANLQVAKTSEELARVTLERNKPLIAQGAISQQEFDVFAARYASSQAETMAAQAALDSAKLDLSFTEIRAPFTGRMSANLIDPGNLVVPNTTVLANLVSQQPIYVYFNIDEAALLRYRSLRSSLPKSEEAETLREFQIPVTLALGNDDEFDIEGVIDYIDPEVDSTTGTIRVRAFFANEDGRLVPGLFGRVRVTVAAPRDVVQLPLRAIGTDQNNKFVYVIDKDGVAQYRQVRLGRESEALAVIEEGISAGDKVVIDGLLKIRPGSKPEVREADLSSFRAPAPAEPVAGTGGEAEVATP